MWRRVGEEGADGGQFLYVDRLRWITPRNFISRLIILIARDQVLSESHFPYWEGSGASRGMALALMNAKLSYNAGSSFDIL